MVAEIISGPLLEAREGTSEGFGREDDYLDSYPPPLSTREGPSVQRNGLLRGPAGLANWSDRLALRLREGMVIVGRKAVDSRVSTSRYMVAQARKDAGFDGVGVVAPTGFEPVFAVRHALFQDRRALTGFYPAPSWGD